MNGNGKNGVWKRVGFWAAIIIPLLGLVFGGYKGYESLATEEEMKKELDYRDNMMQQQMIQMNQAIILNQNSITLDSLRLERKIITDKIYDLEKRKDRIELKEHKTQYDKERIKEYTRDIKQLEEELHQLDLKK